MESKVTHWIRMSEIKQYYLASLDNSLEMRFMFGEEEFKKLNYKPRDPNLRDFIRYAKEFKVSGWNTAIIDRNNRLIKIAYGKKD